MSLPLPPVQSLADSVSFQQTVLPFVSQLKVLPAALQEAGRDVVALKQVYLATNPLVTSLALCVTLAGFFLVFSEITRNHSQVDRCWSLLPAVYNVHYAVWARMAGIRSETLDTIAAITVIWSLRLTYNYWRKGGYQIGSEDYRWQYVRSKINNRFLFFIFNIVFISAAQSLLLFAITTPTYNFLLLSQVKDTAATTTATTAFSLPDLLFSRFAFALIIIEYFADQQQWQFHRAKADYHANARISEPYKDQYTPEDLERGFVINGLWSLSRHPNFAAEQAFWLTFYLWNAYRTESYLQWTGLGVLGYLLVFQGSTPLTESISASKYPEYSEYQARVGRFIPRFSVKPRYKGSKARKQKAAEQKTE